MQHSAAQHYNRLSIVADIDMMRKIGLEKQDATKNKWVEVLPAFAKK